MGAACSTALRRAGAMATGATWPSVERVEFLKGPAAALYGSSRPGGTLNVVTKSPSSPPRTRRACRVGALGYRRATLDSTGPLGTDVAYRLNVAAEDGASRTSLVDNRKMVVAPAITWNLGPNTVLNYEAGFIRIRTPLDRGIVQVNGNAGALPRDRYLGDPSREQPARERRHAPVHAGRTTWARAGARAWAPRTARPTCTAKPWTLTGTLQADGRTLTRRDSWRSLPARDTSVQAEVEGKLQDWRPAPHRARGRGIVAAVHGAGHSLLHPGQPAFAIDIHSPPGQAPATSTPGTTPATASAPRACSCKTRWT